MASIWDAISDFLSKEAGQRRTQALNEGLAYYVPPELRQKLGLLAEMTPTATAQRAGQASERMMAPDRTAAQRVGDLGAMLSETAGVVAPAVVANRVAMPVAQAVQEGLLGFSMGADDMGRRFVERMNQPGPVPTMYSNPVMRAADDVPTGIKAYHGSPHDFDRFSMDKIGTGEGAQAYGHGLYFAEAENVAKKYRDDLAGWGSAGAARTLEAVGGDVDRAILETQQKLERLLERNKMGAFKGAERQFNMQKQIQEDKISQLKSFKETGEFNRGRMYEVNIKANPEDFLDWDKPLSEQSQKVREAMAAAIGQSRIEMPNGVVKMDNGRWSPAVDGTPIGRPTGWPDKATAEQAMKYMVEDDAPYLYGNAGAIIRRQNGNAQRQISQKMTEAGIPGIKYLDAGSRGAGDGSRNYVVFDENLIEIVRKYGIAGAAALLGVSAMDVEQAMAQGSQPQPQGLLSGVQ